MSQSHFTRRNRQAIDDAIPGSSTPILNAQDDTELAFVCSISESRALCSGEHEIPDALCRKQNWLSVSQEWAR